MKITYRNVRFSMKNQAKVIKINAILEEYSRQGYILTLRQLYYQLVSRDLIPNTDREYKNLSTLLGNARMGGYVDWNAIEDRTRVPKRSYVADDLQDAMNDIIYSYKLNRMEGQDIYIEVWIEKDALSSIFKRVTEDYTLRLMVNRGYSSISAMHNAYKRFRGQGQSVILYFGDHDPSGLDMVRDVHERLLEFGEDVEVRQLALTMPQIEMYNPPPNPTKITDPRAEWYINEHGNTSWELDALQPSVLEQICRDEIENMIDREIYEAILEKEDIDKDKMRKLK